MITTLNETLPYLVYFMYLPTIKSLPDELLDYYSIYSWGILILDVVMFTITAVAILKSKRHSDILE